MVKRKVKAKTPSRARYEEQHPVFSGRLDKGTDDRFRQHLASTGCSFNDFVKDAFGRQESMVEERVQILASKKTDPSFEDRVRCPEDLVHQLVSLAASTFEWPPICPHCQNEELVWTEGTQTQSTLPMRQVLTWRCPRCGFFINTANRIDPNSLETVDLRDAQSSYKARASTKSRWKT